MFSRLRFFKRHKRRLYEPVLAEQEKVSHFSSKPFVEQIIDLIDHAIRQTSKK